jgi:hypothetical protein
MPAVGREQLRLWPDRPRPFISRSVIFERRALRHDGTIFSHAFIRDGHVFPIDLQPNALGVTTWCNKQYERNRIARINVGPLEPQQFVGLFEHDHSITLDGLLNVEFPSDDVVSLSRIDTHIDVANSGVAGTLDAVVDDDRSEQWLAVQANLKIISHIVNSWAQ